MDNRTAIAQAVELARLANHIAGWRSRDGLSNDAAEWRSRRDYHMAAARQLRRDATR